RLRREAGVLTRTQEYDEIINRVAALDLGKAAELVCCVRAPDPDQPPRRQISQHVTAGLQEREEPRHDRQTPTHRRAGHRGRLTSGIQRTQVAVTAGLTRVLGVINASTSAGRISPGGLPTTVKNTFRSYASTVFGRHRPPRNSRYTSASGIPIPTT